MKRRFLAAGLALVPVTGLALVLINVATENNLTLHSVNQSRDIVAAAPQSKFGFREAAVAMVEPPPTVKNMTAIDVRQDSPGRTTATIVPSDLSPGLPKIAYRYEYGFRLDPNTLVGVQRAHADYCERQGPMICRIVSLEQSGEDGERTSGSLELAVVTTRARSFGSELSKQVASAGGKEVASSISGEDLSKAIVDTEARIRARTMLRDRLMEVLATRKGTVAELVEAERGVAQVNEEIDEARSWLAEMKGRVEFSAIHIGYDSFGASPQNHTRGGFWSPIRGVIGALGGILGTMIALLIALAAIALPLIALGWSGRKIWRRYRPSPAEVTPA